MRPVLAGDVFALARALEALPMEWRLGVCARLMEETEFADKYRKRFNVLHPHWGNGSLLGRVGSMKCDSGAAPAFHSREFCVSVALVLEVLDRWRAYKSRCGGRVNLPVVFTISEFSP